jgi:predicted NodU family carbamoyl transferase
VQDGKVIAAGQEERFTRKKHDASFLKKNAVEFFLKQGGINTFDLDYVGFYDKPLQVVFFVLAQVILPFLALSFYRWDINVRMSTS